MTEVASIAISDTARNVVAYRIRQENPKLTPQEAQKLALQRTYTAISVGVNPSLRLFPETVMATVSAIK